MHSNSVIKKTFGFAGVKSASKRKSVKITIIRVVKMRRKKLRRLENHRLLYKLLAVTRYEETSNKFKKAEHPHRTPNNLLPTETRNLNR